MAILLIVIGSLLGLFGIIDLVNIIAGNPEFAHISVALSIVLMVFGAIPLTLGILLKRKNKGPGVQGDLTALRLNNPNHQAHGLIETVTGIINKNVALENPGLVRIESGIADALPVLVDAIQQCPADQDIKMVKAMVEKGAAQFKTAEETVDHILSIDPYHFEARMLKDHWTTWQTALDYSYWDEAQVELSPSMIKYLSSGIPVQIVRDGVQKALVIISRVKQVIPAGAVNVKFVLSDTPYGYLAAYYQKVDAIAGPGDVMEGFLPITQPQAHIPMEQYYLIRQLACTPYVYVVHTPDAQPGYVCLNRRVLLSPSARQTVQLMADQISARPHFISAGAAQSAMNWYMNNTSMESIRFDI